MEVGRTSYIRSRSYIRPVFDGAAPCSQVSFPGQQRRRSSRWEPTRPLLPRCLACGVAAWPRGARARVTHAWTGKHAHTHTYTYTHTNTTREREREGERERERERARARHTHTHTHTHTYTHAHTRHKHGQTGPPVYKTTLCAGNACLGAHARAVRTAAV